MLRVKKEHVGKVNVTVVGHGTIELNENTPQEDLELLSKDETAKVFIEEVKPEKTSEIKTDK